MPFVITQKRPYTVYVEAGGSGAIAHVAELPGCFAKGSTAQRAAAAVPQAITEFLVWLRSFREPLVPEAHIARPTILDISVAEVRAGGASTAGGSGAALFEFDTYAWDNERLERTIRWLGYSRTSLLARVEGMTDQALRGREIPPGRSLWATLWHVANAELAYADHIRSPLDGAEPVSETEAADVRTRLAATREILVRRARELPVERRGETLFAPWTERPEEPWTLAKALRRALEHEREHTNEI